MTTVVVRRLNVYKRCPTRWTVTAVVVVVVVVVVVFHDALLSLERTASIRANTHSTCAVVAAVE